MIKRLWAEHDYKEGFNPIFSDWKDVWAINKWSDYHSDESLSEESDLSGYFDETDSDDDVAVIPARDEKVFLKKKQEFEDNLMFDHMANDQEESKQKVRKFTRIYELK